MALDYNLMIDSLPLYASAAAYTLYLAFCGIALSVAIGLFCAFVLYYKTPYIGWFVKGYIELSRNTPLLIQLFFLHFGLKLESESCAFIGLAFLGGSYMAEAFRGGLEAVEKIQIESASALGLNRLQTALYVVIPQALIVSIPSIGANIIFLVKETSVVSIIAISDILAVAKDIISIHYATSEALIMLTLSYLVLLLPISIAAHFAEKKVKFGVFGY
ncbi:MAG: amino acid ABC transporter permease [Helicobacteraceae bacterium]|jgi:polar amino acid transport system permease protein|nr:amino acid ABC transporter permease [Helicobacteraceae bacterium]